MTAATAIIGSIAAVIWLAVIEAAGYPGLVAAIITWAFTAVAVSVICRAAG